MSDRRTRRAIAVASAFALLPGCSASIPATPAEPPASRFERPSRMPWGDAVAARLGGLAGHIHNQLHEDRGGVRETHYVARSLTSVALLEGWYRSRLGDGWVRKPLSLLPEEHGFAFVADRHAFAAGWLDPLPDGRVPVITMRYGDEDQAGSRGR